MSQASKRMFSCIKYSRRRIRPIFLFKRQNGRTIRVVEKNDENSKFAIYLTSENVEKDVLRQLRMGETVFDVW